MKPDKKVKVTGEISSIKFRNSEGWSVFQVKTTDPDPMFCGVTTCTGTLASMIDVGTSVTCTGVIEVGKFGRQVKCDQVVPAAPDVSTDAGVIKLLQRLPGIGPKKAMMAVQQFGHKEAWRLAGIDPEKIGVKAEHKNLAISIAATLLESYEATVYLLGIGLTDYQAGLIYGKYGKESIKVVSEDPYRLIDDIDGMGFITVDKIALKAGVSVGNPARITACILYVLDDSQSNGGNIWHNGWSLVEIVLQTLTDTAMKAEVSISGAPDKDEVRKQVHFLQAEGKIAINKGRVFSKTLLDAESAIFDFISGEIWSGDLSKAMH